MHLAHGDEMLSSRKIMKKVFNTKFTLFENGDTAE